jgi:glutamyl-tRNA synthetase
MSHPKRVVTRFAPSPTGFLHIGGARTALFNWLFSRHHGGDFLLRIEDTDRARSTPEAVEAILDGLNWLGLNWDGQTVFQFARAQRHAEVALGLLETGGAYRCFATPEELTEMREAQKAAGLPQRYDGRWRDRDPAEAAPNTPFVVRMRAPTAGATTISDLVQGDVTVNNEQLDDMILLRSDGTPTYMLSVVVDDHDMGITHVIRGDDHLTNAFRQTQLYRVCGWETPTFAHIPLIHGADGAKLSKRHGALGVDAYRDLGYLPEALRNYLLRLGWSHGDEEKISTAQAIEWFDLDKVGRSAARFDFAKLQNLNAQYLRQSDDAALAAAVAAPLSKRLGAPLSAAAVARLEAGMGSLKQRAKLLTDLAESAALYATDESPQPDEKALAMLISSHAVLKALIPVLTASASWTAETLEATVRDWAIAAGKKLGEAAQPLRAALAGSLVSPPIFEVMAILGRDLTQRRLQAGLARGQ